MASFSTVHDCISSVLDEDGDFSIPSTRNQSVKSLARKILGSESGEETLQAFENTLLRRLCDVLKASASSTKFSERKRRLWSEFHTLRSTELKEMWHTFLQNAAISTEEADPLLMQYVFEKMFESVLQTHFCNETSEYNLAELTVSEHNALRYAAGYAAGYVPRALIGKMSRGSHPYKDTFLQCLSSMGEKGTSSGTDDIQAFTKQWLTSVNRGGLTFVSDEVYVLFYQMEIKIRRHLYDLTSKKCINKVTVIEDIAMDDEVLFQWCLISTDIDDESASQELLCKIVEQWLTIRGFSTAGAYVEYYKQCNKKNLKKSTGLRRGLKRKHTEVEE